MDDVDGDGEPALVREDEQGNCAREKLANGTYMDDDALKDELPEVFHGLAQDLRRVEI